MREREKMGFDVITPEAGAHHMGRSGAAPMPEGVRSLSPHNGPVTDVGCFPRREPNL